VPQARFGGRGFLVLGRSRRRWHRIILATVGFYGLACLGLSLLERRISYQPIRTRTDPAAVRLVHVNEQSLRTPDGERLIVWRLPAKPGLPTILYFHGNGDPLTYRSGRVGSFEAEGYGVHMMAYRGFSGSTGSPSEDAIVADALLAYDTLRSEGVAAEDIIIYGESLGTNVALRTALARPAAGLILEAPFTSMIDAWRQFVPLLPVGLMLRDRYDSLSIIGRLTIPLLVLHGRKDRLVAFRLGQQLFAAAPEPKRLEVFPEAGHTNLYDYNAIAAVRLFVADLRAGRLAR
jgi:uncharacterized protein